METQPLPPERQIMALVTAFQLSQAVGTLAALRVPDAFGDRARRSADVAADLGVDADALERLVRACATGGLFEPADDGAWKLTEVGHALRSDAPGGAADFAVAMTSSGHWLPWGRLRDAVRSGEPVVTDTLGASLWDYYDSHPEERDRFAGAMSAISRLVAEHLPKAFDASPYRTIVDVGGSHGVILESLLRSAPDARGVVQDLETVLDGARATLAQSGLADRIELVPGDFFERVYPGGDLYILKHILHDWSDDRAATILRNIRSACAPGATLLVLEMPLPEPFAPSRPSILDLTMLVLLGGRERTVAEYERLLAEAAFRLARVVDDVGAISLLEARAI